MQIFPSGSDSAAAFSATFQQFRRILALNNRVLEKIGRMEAALAGEYVFDRRFLAEVVAELNELVREVVYCLNSLTGNRYLALYERYEEIAGKLAVLAAEYAGPYDRNLAVGYDFLNGDFEELVGGKNATLCEIRNVLKLPAPDGFAITVTAYREFMEANGLFAEIDSICKGPGPRLKQSDLIRRALQEAAIPDRLADAVGEELGRLLERCGSGTSLAVRSSGVGEDAETRSFAGQFQSVLEVQPGLEAVLAAYRQVIASRFSVAALEYLGVRSTSRDLPMAVGVQPMIRAEVSGVTYSRSPEEPEKNNLLITALRGGAGDLVSGRLPADRFLLSRSWPFPLLESEIFPSGSSREEYDRYAILPSGLRRGSAILLPAELAYLAEQALLLEKAFGGPQDIEWAMEQEAIILQSRPFALPVKPQPLPGEIAAELRGAVPLLEGKGQVAQLGIAAGTVVQVDQGTDPEQFPVGAIAVARFPSPQLSPIVWRAAAIITDIGGPTGHLATIAREYRTPALFGTGDASRVLREGEEITVDVENKKVYRGRLEGLVQLQAAEVNTYRTSPELRILRRLLRWVAPITLVDPGSPDFRAGNCRTFHDILRFCHEKAIESLIKFHGRGETRKALPGIPVRLEIPIKLRVIDIGAGLLGSDQAGVGMEMVNSRPLKAILAGLSNPAAWDREPVPLGLRDLLSSMSRPISTLTVSPAYAGENFAIIAENYCNLSLRLGYHFNVIDAYLSPEPDDNYIYFRFVGGIADRTKRDRRARLIADILAGLFFKVERQGDLIVAKARNLDIPQMERVLARLGELVGFTRQLDVQMRDEDAVERFFQRFLDSIRQDRNQ